MEKPTQRGSVLVTGASTGIGRGCVQFLAEHGFEVFGTVRREEDGASLAREIRGVHAVRLDVTDDGEVERARAELAARLGERGLAGLVNNAGIGVPGPLEALPIERFRYQLEVNLVGVLRVTQAFLPLLRAGRGRIVNMSSINGRIAFPFFGPYNASKFALEGMSDALRLELDAWSIPVVLIEPGAIRTPIWSRSRALAEEIEGTLPAELHARYAAAYQKIYRAAELAERKGAPVEAVGRAVLRALTDARPRARYLVGRDARILSFLARWLPDRWRDRLLLKRLGLTTRR